MNKLFAALIAGAFAFVSASALAQAPAQAPATKPKPATQPIPSDSSLMPLSKMSTEDAKAARAAAKAKWDTMTPEEKAATKTAAAKKRQEELTAMEAVAADQGPVYDTKQGAADAKASKAMPTPTKEQRQQDLKSQEKGTKGQ